MYREETETTFKNSNNFIVLTNWLKNRLENKIKIQDWEIEEQLIAMGIEIKIKTQDVENADKGE